MDLEVVGRHALLFDDDAMAAFVNSSAALVEWNSLSIDRYDVRHLLSAPPSPRSRLRHQYSSLHPEDSIEAEINHERYLDLTSLAYSQDLANEAEEENAGGYHMVPFSYGNASESTDLNTTDAESGFCPPFSVPEHLLQNLPPTEKVHQIIARTAMFVSKHGGQSEIVLRVKQGDNPTFGFLMPDHDLHPYFRFLVDHQELVKSDTDGKFMEDNRVDSGVDKTGGVGSALSLLNSVYGSGEDEEGANKDAPMASKKESEEAGNVDKVTSSSVNVAGKDEASFKHPVPSSKEKAHVIKRNCSITTVKAGSTAGVKKQDFLGSVSSTVDNLQASKVEPSILEPPSDLKRVVDKIVEFILRNGKEFEAVLVQQDTKHGRFPFLLPSNQYHLYYLKVLQKAQESRVAGKGFVSDNRDSQGHGIDKKTTSKKGDALSLSCDIPYDSDRKEKFKMVLGKSKKDVQDPPSKATQPQVGVSVDAAAAAAILQAATKGIRYPSLDILSKTSINGISQGASGESGEASSFGSVLSSHPQCSTQKLGQRGESDVSVPVAKAIAKTASIAAASEADSSEASLTREQKLKAERLKRAKMFTAMIKSGDARLKSEPLRGLSNEPPESGHSGPGAQVTSLAEEKEGSSVPLGVDTGDTIEKADKIEYADAYNERRSKRRYRMRSKRGEDETDADEEEEEREGEGEQGTDHKHSRKKRRSHHSSRHSRDRHKHRKRHSSSKEKYFRNWHKPSGASDDEYQHPRYRPTKDSSADDEHRHKQDVSSDDERMHSRHRHRHDTSSDDENRYSRHKYKHNVSSDHEHRRSQHSRRQDGLFVNDEKPSHQRDKHDSSSDDERDHSLHRYKHCSTSDDEHHWHSGHWRKHGNSSDEEHQHRIKSVKHWKTSHSEREADLEEGEILTKSDQSKASEGGDGASREASVDLSKSYQDVKAPSQLSETTQVSDNLRAKVRAMLLATL